MSAPKPFAEWEPVDDNGVGGDVRFETDADHAQCIRCVCLNGCGDAERDEAIAAINSAVSRLVREARAGALKDLAKWAGTAGMKMTREQFVGCAVVVSEALCRARAEAEEKGDG